MSYSSVEFMPLETTTPSHYNKMIFPTLLEVCCDIFHSENMNWCSFFLMGFSFTGMGSTFYKFNYIYHVSMY